MAVTVSAASVAGGDARKLGQVRTNAAHAAGGASNRSHVVHSADERLLGAGAVAASATPAAAGHARAGKRRRRDREFDTSAAARVTGTPDDSGDEGVAAAAPAARGGSSAAPSSSAPRRRAATWKQQPKKWRSNYQQPHHSRGGAGERVRAQEDEARGVTSVHPADLDWKLPPNDPLHGARKSRAENSKRRTKEEANDARVATDEAPRVALNRGQRRRRYVEACKSARERQAAQGSSASSRSKLPLARRCVKPRRAGAGVILAHDEVGALNIHIMLRAAITTGSTPRSFVWATPEPRPPARRKWVR